MRKRCPREETAENPLVVRVRAWSPLSGFAADKKLHDLLLGVGRAASGVRWRW